MLRSILVKDYMEANLAVLRPDMDVLDAIHLFLDKRVTGAPVIDDHGGLVGWLSEKDCLKIALHAGYHEGFGGKVSGYMSSPVASIDADASMVEVAERFLHSNYRAFPVVTDNRVVGYVNRADVLRALETLW